MSYGSSKMKVCKRNHALTPENTYKTGRCKQCAHEVQREYRKKRPKAMLDAQKRWRERNREAENERIRRWKAENPGKSAEYSRSWRERHPERVQEVRSEWYQSHIDEERERGRLRRVRNDPETATYVKILRLDPCSYCGDPHEHVDHVIPVFSGGENHWTNFTSACATCNQAKSTEPLLIFLLKRREC